MSIYATTIAPPQSYLAVEAVHSILTGDSTIVATNYIEASASVYKHDHDENFADRILVVREGQQIGGKGVGMDKREAVGVQVMAMINAFLDNGQKDPYAHHWLYNMHKRIHDALAGQKPAIAKTDSSGNTMLVDNHALVLPIGVWEQNSVPAYDTEFDYWFSTATYIVTLDAVT